MGSSNCGNRMEMGEGREMDNKERKRRKIIMRIPECMAPRMFMQYERKSWQQRRGWKEEQERTKIY